MVGGEGGRTYLLEGLVVGVLGQVLHIDGPRLHLLLLRLLEGLHPGHLVALLREGEVRAGHHPQRLPQLPLLLPRRLAHAQLRQQGGDLVEGEEGGDGHPGVLRVDAGEELGHAQVSVTEVEFHLGHQPPVHALLTPPHLLLTLHLLHLPILLHLLHLPLALHLLPLLHLGHTGVCKFSD